MLNIINSDWWSGLFKDDPVRPHISSAKRMTGNKTAFVLTHEDGIDARAVVCAAFCNDVPKTEQDLDNKGNTVVAFYTVWSYDKGAGREIIQEVTDWVKKHKPEVHRFVTLSPKTEMARRFHIRNGAVELQENKDTVNYEYKV